MYFFKHIRHTFSSANTFETLYEVPEGKFFVLMRKRARHNDVSGSPTVTFANASNQTLDDTISVSVTNGVKLSETSKWVFYSGYTNGSIVKGKSTVAGAIGEIMGLEFPIPPGGSQDIAPSWFYGEWEGGSNPNVGE